MSTDNRQNTSCEGVEKMKARKVIAEVNKVMVGKEDAIKKIMLAILSKGHILLEDVPGVGKTTVAKAFSCALGLKSKRVQFTPDVLPSDIVGFKAYDVQRNEMTLHKGAVFTNLFLADEINRTSSRTQSALLEVMEENQISIDGETYDAYKPFHVLATQNPFGSAGTQRLPENQMDRFMISLSLGYPNQSSELEMLKRKEAKIEQVEQVVSREELIQMQEEVESVYVHEEIMKYVVTLVNKTRQHEKIQLGVSPRGSIALICMAKANAYLCGRDFVECEDIKTVFYEVLTHRLLLKEASRSEEIKIKQRILKEILLNTDTPDLGKDEK